MKRQRLKFKLLALLLFALFALMAAYGAYSVITYGNRWFSSSRNPRVRAQKEAVLAGDILDRTGTVLATVDAEGQRVYQADESARRAIVHLVGDSQGQVSNSVESFQTSYLYGFQASFVEMIGALWRGEQRRGDTVTLTADAALCTEMADAFQRLPNSAGKRGAAVVMNYKTGEVLGAISLPNFDPMNISDSVKADAGQPFWNRVTQSLYPPGSTFKLVTADASLETLPGIEAQTFECTTDVLSFGDHIISDYGGEYHGTVTIREALIYSCNKMYATLAVNVGQQRLLDAAERFGFNDNFLFRDLVVENSAFPRTADSTYTLAASGFGQSSVVATPMHLCMVAAAIANEGVMMEPRLLREVKSASGTQRLSYTASPYRTVMTAQRAATLKSWMRAVVTTGTGRRAAVEGMTICGKTGTADSTQDGQPITYGWFIGFNDDDSLPLSVCVLVENLNEGTSGGSAAAPVAQAIFTWAKAHQAELTR